MARFSALARIPPENAHDEAELERPLEQPLGEDFNATHSDDAISLADALDSLASARAMLMTMAPRDLKYP